MKTMIQSKIKVVSLFVILGVLGINISLYAQYPIIPTDVKAEADSMKEEVKRRSDEAWEKALPIVKEEERQGKPYIP